MSVDLKLWFTQQQQKTIFRIYWISLCLYRKELPKTAFCWRWSKDNASSKCVSTMIYIHKDLGKRSGLYKYDWTSKSKIFRGYLNYIPSANLNLYAACLPVTMTSTSYSNRSYESRRTPNISKLYLLLKRWVGNISQTFNLLVTLIVIVSFYFKVTFVLPPAYIFRKFVQLKMKVDLVL